MSKKKPPTDPLKLKFCHVNDHYLPKINTKAYVLLTILSDGKTHKRNALVKHQKLGESMRSALQDLRGDKLGNWLLHSIPIEGSDTTALQLDPRHLSGDPALDAAARLERRAQYKKVSHKDAVQGRMREPRAFKELTEAESEYLQSLTPANDQQ